MRKRNKPQKDESLINVKNYNNVIKNCSICIRASEEIA